MFQPTKIIGTTMTPRRPSTRGIASLTVALTLALYGAACAEAFGPRTDPPACFSNTPEYLFRQFVVSVQPSTSILVQRYQAPQITIHCISILEEGPTCGSTQGTPQLCQRRADDPTAAFTCEPLDVYTTDPNADVTRGEIHGPDTIWDVKWDGRAKAPQCYPRAVEVRLLAFVRGKDVASDVVWAFLLLIVILALILAAVAFVYFIRRRLAIIDDAGAATIGGPKSDFKGPQMGLTGLGVTDVPDSNKVYLPIQEHGALADLESSKFGRTDAMLGNTPTTGNLRGPVAQRRASPPAPGDGLPDGAFREGRRRQGADVGDGFEDDDDDPLGPGGSTVRRRRRRHGSGYDSATGAGRRSPSRKTLFPTQTDWQATFVEGDQLENGGRRGRLLGYGPNGEEIYEGDDPNAPSFGRLGRGTVKYIPQWQKGNFGKGGVIPELGDGDDPDDSNVRGGNGTRGRLADPRSAGPQSAGRYYGRRSPVRRPGGGPDKPYTDEDDGYETDGSRRSARRGRRRLPDGTYESAGEEGPDAGGRRGRRQQDAYGVEDEYEGAAGGRRSSPRRGRGAAREFGNPVEGSASDAFNRGRAKVFSTDLEATIAGGRKENRAPGGGTGISAPGGLPADQVSLRKPTAMAMQCNACKLVLSGVPGEPAFCTVSGERHF